MLPRELHQMLLRLCGDPPMFPRTQYERSYCRALQDLGYAEWDIAERVWIPTVRGFAYRRAHLKADAA